MRTILTLALAVSLLGAAAPAPPEAAAGAPSLDAATRRQVVTALAAALERVYVFPERATGAAQAILSAEKSGSYDADTNSDAFADALTKTIAGVLHDKHLRVIYSAEPVPSEDRDYPTDRTTYDQDRAEAAAQNFGVLKAIR
ncbi:MAG TPA: hypothetical protein VK760_12350, partial [Candidatus Acidoferrales bacterium]|nr:hypothetical protein [Candidatus Acidoferrales bacterium]